MLHSIQIQIDNRIINAKHLWMKCAWAAAATYPSRSQMISSKRATARVSVSFVQITDHTNTKRDISTDSNEQLYYLLFVLFVKVEIYFTNQVVCAISNETNLAHGKQLLIERIDLAGVNIDFNRFGRERCKHWCHFVHI